MGQDTASESKLIEKTNWFANRRTNTALIESANARFVPDSLVEAYSVQERVVGKLGWHVGGWKLGGTNHGTREKFECKNAYYGPIEEEKIVYSESRNSFEWHLPGSFRGEAEISFRLSSKVDQLRELSSLEDVFAYVDALAPSLECPYCTIDDVQSLGLAALIADLCGSGYLVLGKVIPVSQVILGRHQVVEIEQLEKKSGVGNTLNIIGSPLQALYEFLNLAFEHKLELREGQWVATGGCTPCIEFIPNSLVTVKFECMESFTCLVRVPEKK
jgi:2-keto-4-pentenoate hydratase